MNYQNQLALVWTYLGRTPLLWLTATVVCYVVAQAVYEKLNKRPLANPVLLSVLAVILLLRVTHTEYAAYMQGGQFIHFLLGPAIVALAVPLNRQLPKLRSMFWPLACGLVAGGLGAITTTVLLARALGASAQSIASIAPRSATAGIAIRISEKIGGIPSLTAVLVVMTGITGAVIAVPVLRLLRVRRPEIVGLAMGLAGHGIATARALQISEEAGAFAGLGMSLNGVLTACALPVLYPMLMP
ncbi:LrgB family protein [Caballeronia catudaia]|uniref:LrgB family protein n=1 Tax=Caballeronia catudaia TaxID=1777136 RepID=A0A158DB82_9BURK|nr:LrgB family protein [Caballeronia catudaia]SAK91922.1 LrgB family protein [Caballeronia catudaia]